MAGLFESPTDVLNRRRAALNKTIQGLSAKQGDNSAQQTFKGLGQIGLALAGMQQREQQQEQASQRKELVGSGDRSQRIRTYNYPQGRVTDHRINLTLYKLNEVMEGELESIIDPLILEQQTNQLTELNATL